MMQTINISKRPGELKGSIASRPELHGDDVVPALTLSIGGILLFAKDLIAMYNDPDAHSRLFTSTGGAGLVPAFPGTLLYVSEIFKGAKVTLKTKNMESLVLKPATIKDIWLECQDAGGHVVMSCKVLGAPAEDAEVNPLHMLAQKCTIAISGGQLAGKDENQGELPLDEGGPAPASKEQIEAALYQADEAQTEVEREEAEATESVIGRQIRRAAKKKAASRKKK